MSCAARPILISTLFFCAVSPASAQHKFDYVSVHGEHFATIELSKLPATHEDVVSLTFVQPDGAPFGFGKIYGGVLDEMSEPGGKFMLSDSGGLTGNDDAGSMFAVMRDTDPPTTTNAIQDATVLGFRFYASVYEEHADQVGGNDFFLDRIEYTYRLPDGTVNDFSSFGYWQAVPEPNCGSIAVTVALLFIARPTRSRPQQMIADEEEPT